RTLASVSLLWSLVVIVAVSQLRRLCKSRRHVLQGYQLKTLLYSSFGSVGLKIFWGFSSPSRFQLFLQVQSWLVPRCSAFAVALQIRHWPSSYSKSLLLRRCRQLQPIGRPYDCLCSGASRPYAFLFFAQRLLAQTPRVSNQNSV